MKLKVAESAIGIAWLEIVHRDGAVNSLSHISELDVDVATKERLLTTYLRLRLKRIRPEAIAKLCPLGLMKMSEQDRDQALSELPRVSEGAPELTFGSPEEQRQADAIMLGLHDPVGGLQDPISI